MARKSLSRGGSGSRRGESAGSAGDYEVGYGRPPRETQFKPGNRANPRGRHKGSKNTATMAREALERPVTVTQNGAQRKMTVRQLAYRKLADKAVMGDQKALAFLLMLAGEYTVPESSAAEAASSETDLEIINEFLSRQKAAPTEGS
jgi:uncharacterized protein DUF5681